MVTISGVPIFRIFTGNQNLISFQTESVVKKLEEITVTGTTNEESVVKKIEEIMVMETTNDEPALSKVKVTTVTENGHDEEITAAS